MAVVERRSSKRERLDLIRRLTGPGAEQDVLELGSNVAEALERPLAPILEKLDLLPQLVDPATRVAVDLTGHVLGRLAHRPCLLFCLRDGATPLLLRLAAML